MSGNLYPLPMFPLGDLLFPGVAIPLHVFEPRYKKLVEDLSKGQPRFGIVLITRGSEVGGGDQRSNVGTIARIAEKVLLDDGRWVILAVGEDRITIHSWLPDDPYPVALVGTAPQLTDLDQAPQSLVEELNNKLRYALLLKSEVSLEGNFPIAISFSSDVQQAIWQMCAVAPIPALDKQKLLEIGVLSERIAMLDSLLSEAILFLEGQLSAK